MGGLLLDQLMLHEQFCKLIRHLTIALIVFHKIHSGLRLRRHLIVFE